MKYIFTIFCLFAAAATDAQWSNTTNLFADNFHMTVCNATGDQQHSIVVRSYPDGGYFMVWEDKRLGFYGVTGLYAQKYDKDGNRLWAENGLPVSVSTNEQHFTYASNQDYRNRRVAASDKNGGLYITYLNDSVATYNWSRVCVQHLLADGSRVFAGAGYLAAQPIASSPVTYDSPQLIADDEGGFYVAYVSRNNSVGDYVEISNYEDVNGSMVFNGYGRMNQNAVSRRFDGPCVGSSRLELYYPGTNVIDYNIWPDLQGNCSVVMNMTGNIGSQGNMLCYNKLWKAKQAAAANVVRLYPTGDLNAFTINYSKGQVEVLYQLLWNALNRECASGQNHYLWVDYEVISQGYQVIAAGALSYFFPKGTTLTTPGNINVEVIASTRRTLENGSASAPVLFANAFADEQFAAIPYQRASNNNPIVGYNTVPPATLDSLKPFADSILSAGQNSYDFSLAAGANQLYASALVQEKTTDNFRKVYLQHMSVQSAGAGLYEVAFNSTGKTGEAIGAEINTGFGGSSISYDLPMVTANATGNALFSITEAGRYTRVSPVLQNAQLAWGAMGRAIGSPQINGNYVSPEQAFAALDPADGTGVISWTDARGNASGTGREILMRHLDNLNVNNYLPPNKTVQPLVNGSNFANPAYLAGSSKKYSAIEVVNFSTSSMSPVVELLDNYPLGAIQIGIYEQNGSIRNSNGKAYLNRNYTITPANNPNGAADIHLRLYFTIAQFDALKLADPGITDPGDLSVIKQPNNNNTTPDSYIPNGSEIEIRPVSWSAVSGGYYLEIVINSFSNFFIQKASAALPVTWLGVQATATGDGHAKISWQVADQVNVKEYTVQESTDGTVFTSACTVPATTSDNYACSLPLRNNAVSWYRVVQLDLDGRFTYSKLVSLRLAVPVILQVRPNPASNYLYVEGIGGFYQCEISDGSGRLLQRIASANAARPIDISKLPPGWYIISVKSDREQKSMSFIKR